MNKKISEKFMLVSKKDLQRVNGGKATKTFAPRGATELVRSIAKKLHIG